MASYAQGCSAKTISAYREDASRGSHLAGTQRQAFLRTDQTPCNISPSSQCFRDPSGYFYHLKDPKYQEM